MRELSGTAKRDKGMKADCSNCMNDGMNAYHCHWCRDLDYSYFIPDPEAAEMRKDELGISYYKGRYSILDKITSDMELNYNSK
jgi:hypothetical protein